MTADPAWLREVEAYCARQRELLVDARTQVDCSLLAAVASDLALVRLVRGVSLREVRMLLREAATAVERVFALRGTSTSIEVDAAGRGEIDDSLASPALAREGMLFALAFSDITLARRIAAHAPQSPLARLILDQPITQPSDNWETAAITALATRDRRALQVALEDLCDADAREARTEPGASNPQVQGSLVPTALATEALRRQVLEPDELPARLRERFGDHDRAG